MPASTSELRLTRNQLPLPSHAETSPAFKPMASNEDVESASKATNNKLAPGRGRRKALADLAGNDSPIVGLIPGLHNCASRTPSCELKCNPGAQNCSKKPFLSMMEDSINTPIGESLLRSQVKLLLQKVESDAPTIHKPAPSLRALCHLRHTLMDSPALKIVAPTPVNTPCSNNLPFVEQAPSIARMTDLHSTPERTDDQKFLGKSSSQEEKRLAGHVLKVQASGIKLLVDLHISPEVEAVAPCESLPLLSKVSEDGHITITESVLSGRDHHIMQVTPLISEAYDKVDLLALGKKTTRTLQFDSPDKVLAAEMSCCSMASPEKNEGFVSAVRELEEDEASEWSVLVNVSSPDQGKCDIEAELYEEDSADSSNSHFNQKPHVWSSRRRGTPFPKGTFTGDEEEAEEQSDGSQIGYSEEDAVESMQELEGGEEEGAWSKGLPRGEGKHIRFSFDSDNEM